MSKYNYDKQLKIRGKAFFVKRLLPIANAVISVLPKGLDKKQVIFRNLCLDGLKLHTVTPKNLISTPDLPCLLYIHGGGFGYKESFVQYKYEQAYAVGAECTVVGVDYPLLPKYVYPSAIEYVVSAYEAIVANAEVIGVDPTRIAIGGDSAGGSLATELAYALAEHNIVEPIGVMLVYPVVDGKQRPSMLKYSDVPFWDSVCNKKMWAWYLDGAEYISPIDREIKPTIKNLFVETEEYDCLHDEGVALYQTLVPLAENAVLLDNNGTFHGYDVNFKADITQKSLQIRVAFLQKTFEQ